jgi:hypothetical protein
MVHTHLIDNKVLSFDENTCPICHPEQQQQQKQEQEEILPRVYRKVNTIVLKITKGRMLTVNYWTEGKVYLMTVQHILLKADDTAQLDKDGKAIWVKDTLRVPATILREYLSLTSILYNEVESKGVIPKRD